MELKPCPFCEPEYQWHTFGGGGNVTYVLCNMCGGRGPHGKGEKGAALVWSTRATPPEGQALVEAVRAHLFSDGTHAALESALLKLTQEGANG